MEEVNAESSGRIQSIRAATGAADRDRFVNWSNRNPATPFTASLLEDPRIYIPAEQLVGADSVPVHSNGNSYPADTGWHPDTEEQRLMMVKNVLYLQPTTSERGALRLIPGSHRNPLNEELHHLKIGDSSRYCSGDIPSYVFSSVPGDLITFDSLTWHAAIDGFSDRRTCTFNFYGNPGSAAEK
jgi:ectoine hydroxylase-related dioxygenase (phytanoyl-CoA dioxygenase family)